MFNDLSLIIFVPFICFILLIKLKQYNVIRLLTEKSASLSAYLISALLFFAVALQRDAFTLSYDLFIEFIILTILYLLYYGIGFSFKNTNSVNRLSLAICSGANNNALAITVAASFFTATELRFNVLSELHWFIAIMILSKLKGKKL